ncbi:MAG: peptide chain release factor N(5)-glutamine methyltransferase [Bifidobacteriaceae bacterium]|jgi:release factor glutamine methyltransferase|nr:peptide chain release factor N(5)-glutamine methyltransferase [Bifidobacteriaceae bacterium]
MKLSDALHAAAAHLSRAGIVTARLDAELLAGHLLGRSLGQVRAAAIAGREVDEDFTGPFNQAVGERAKRVPLQHITGSAPFRHLSLAVGPGVFIPRPETEQVAEVAITSLRQLDAESIKQGRRRHLIAVDLCTGSGALAAAIASEVPRARVWAVEIDHDAFTWAERNLEDTGVTLVLGDAATALPELDGTVDLVVANPPYIAPNQVPTQPEVRDYDPPVALYGQGPDGLDVPKRVLAAAARLTRPGGVIVMEHGDGQGPALRRLAARLGPWRDIKTLPDLAGRDRMLYAVRRPVGRLRGPDDDGANGAADRGAVWDGLVGSDAAHAARREVSDRPVTAPRTEVAEPSAGPGDPVAVAPAPAPAPRPAPRAPRRSAPALPPPATPREQADRVLARYGHARPRRAD